MQTDGTNTLSLIVGAVQSNSKETSSDRRCVTAPPVDGVHACCP